MSWTRASSLHLHETEVEIQDSLARYGRRPLRRLEDLGLLRPGFTAVHMNRLDEEDLETAARTGIAVVACPQSNLRLRSGQCPIGELTGRDIAVGLGTDGAASVGALDILAEARCAALLSGTMLSEEALKLATLGGATALGLSGTVGSLEPGKAADFICIDLGTLACQPDHAVADSIVFCATRHQITDVWVGGRAAVAQGRLLTFDEPELLRIARSWAARIHGARE